MCTKDYIVNIDSDELPNVELLNILPGILEANPEVDLYYVPRINTVSGITDEFEYEHKVSADFLTHFLM